MRNLIFLFWKRSATSTIRFLIHLKRNETLQLRNGILTSAIKWTWTMQISHVASLHRKPTFDNITIKLDGSLPANPVNDRRMANAVTLKSTFCLP